MHYRSLGRTGVQVSTLALGDAIDAVVAPGLDLAPGEKHDTPPALLDPTLRRQR